MESVSTRLRIFSVMRQIAEEQKIALPSLVDNLSLHETGFDSLAFAILVARLEDDLGVDPFTLERFTFLLKRIRRWRSSFCIRLAGWSG
jgi:acyl carrier protein